jgi:hypothetical protein
MITPEPPVISNLRLLSPEIGSVFTGQPASPPTTDKSAIWPTSRSTAFTSSLGVTAC